MKTKKEILKWYLDKGNEPFGDDKRDLLSNLDNEIVHNTILLDNDYFKIIIFTKRCKHPMTLYFCKYDNHVECYKIVGFY